LPLSYEMHAESSTFRAFWLGATLSGSTVVHNIRTDFAMTIEVTGGRLTDADRVTATVCSPWSEVVFRGGECEVRVEIPVAVRKALSAEFFGPGVPIETLYGGGGEGGPCPPLPLPLPPPHPSFPPPSHHLPTLFVATSKVIACAFVM
jgi:hypothetical protein